METYLQQYVYAGGFMMYFLIPTSLLAVGWIAQGFIRLRRGRVMPRADVELPVDLVQVDLDGGEGDAELLGDLLVRPVFDEQPQDLLLALRHLKRRCPGLDGECLGDVVLRIKGRTGFFAGQGRQHANR